MLRYLAVTWNPSSLSQARLAHTVQSRLLENDSAWRQSLDQEGLWVFTASPRPGAMESTLLHDGAGIVVGSLFRRAEDGESGVQARQLDRHETAQISRSGGRHLVDAYWGSYVAFLGGPSPGCYDVLVAPMSSLPCYMTSLDGLTVFYSRTEDFAQLGLVPLSVSWDCLLAHIVFKHVYCAETAIKEITEVLPGERVQIAGSLISRALLWNPFHLPEPDSSQDPERVAQRIRNTLKCVTHALVAGHDRILHLLSGGLDSSIVLACLADAPTRPAITCLNQRSTDANGDERYFARLVAEPRRCRLIELERSLDIHLETILRSARTANPFHHLQELIVGNPATALAHADGATAISTGTFGDAIFFRRPGRAAPAEYLFRRGVDRQLFRVALWAALLDRTSIWRTLGYAIRQQFLGERRSYWRLRQDLEASWEHTPLINREAASSVPSGTRFLHPWFHDVKDASPGKLWQVLLVTVGTVDNPLAAPDGPQLIDPTMNQLLAEICLTTPVYIHLQGGWDRAMARKAFASELPAAVLKRTSKGGGERYINSLFSRNLPFFRELLLDGILVRERILAKKPLETFLGGEPARMRESVADLFGYLSKEAWLRSWADATSRGAP